MIEMMSNMSLSIPIWGDNISPLYYFVSEDFYSVIYSEFHPLWNFQDDSDCLDVNVDILIFDDEINLT